MFAKIRSAALLGIDAYPLEVEVDISSTVPSFTIVGLPDASVNEAKERVRSAIINSKLSFPYKRVTVNMAPADIKKEGPSFDFPIALGLLAAGEQINARKASEFVVIGELALDGKLRKVNGILSIASMMKQEGVKKILLPKENADEACLIPGIEVYPAEDLAEAVSILRAEDLYPPYRPESDLDLRINYDIDFSDVKGQETSKRALEVAAAGFHNIIMIGPPGSGKTMLAKRVPTILPLMSNEEALEVTRIYSISGMLASDRPLMLERPFRSPHHSASRPGLIGGGTYPRPGEVSLAHRGVLFLDELPEFDRSVLEVLRQPLEDGRVTISRASQTLTFPASFMLVASMNPCPCGFFSDPARECTCTPWQIKKYMMKISGPLIDRIDIHIEVPRLKYEDLVNYRQGDSSDDIRKRVLNARKIQFERFKGKKFFANADMNTREIKKYCKLPADGQMLLKSAIESLGLSARAHDRILKLARTIADLEGVEEIKVENVAEAIQYRSLDRSGMI